MSFKTITEAWGNASVAETLAFKCKDCIPSITHTHTKHHHHHNSNKKNTQEPLKIYLP